VEIRTYLSERRLVVEEALHRYTLEAEGPFARHIEAMRYSLFVGGKRLRPILCLAAAEAINDGPATAAALLPVACALECIHTYSLIHDDLPAMDDDDLRRGKPTNHMLYGEAAAILAGDSLLTWAFDLLTDPIGSAIPAEWRLAIAHRIARAAGPLGMVGGQSLDIASENSEISFATLQTIHRSKTGALITCAVETGAIGAGASWRPARGPGPLRQSDRTGLPDSSTTCSTSPPPPTSSARRPVATPPTARPPTPPISGSTGPGAGPPSPSRRHRTPWPVSTARPSRCGPSPIISLPGPARDCRLA